MFNNVLFFLLFCKYSTLLAQNSPVVYAQVKNSNTALFSSLADAQLNRNPVRKLVGLRYFFKLNCSDTNIGILKENFACQTSSGEFVRMNDLEEIKPSELSGHVLKQGDPLNFGWSKDVLRVYKSLPTSHKSEHIELPINSPVWIEKEVQLNGEKWVKLQNEGWVKRKDIRRFYKVKRNPKIPIGKKWIHVRISEQTLAAYEGDQLVFATLISSGRRSKETKRGVFQIYKRLTVAQMAGDLGDPDYFVFESIPYHLYFYKNLALHGAYSRTQFGNKGSHGCINLSLKDSEWIWNWVGGNQNLGQSTLGEYVWIDD